MPLFTFNYFQYSFQLILLILLLKLRFLLANIFEEDSMTFIIEDDSFSGEQNATHRILMDTDDFKLLRLYGKVFVDKSEIVSEYLDRGGLVLVITRPHKWGKSVNINMLKRFFEIEVDECGIPLSEEKCINSVLFSGGNIKLSDGRIKKLEALKVAQSMSGMDYHGKNPVILVSFKGVDGSSYEEFESCIAEKINTVCKNYLYLNQYLTNNASNEINAIFKSTSLRDSLYILSKLLFLHFKRNVYIFIDDYDTPIANAYLRFRSNSKEFEQVVEVTYQILQRALKDNQYLERGILTGTFHFGWVNEILKLNNIRHSSIVDMTFSKFYGFTKDEVEKILTQIQTRVNKVQIKEWYNGYNFDGAMIHNPWSVLSCLSGGGKLDYYWEQVVNQATDLVGRVYLLDSAQEYLHQLLQNKVITRKDVNKPINLEQFEDNFYRPLLFAGFLNPESAFCESNCYIHPWNLSVPNREVKGMLAEGVATWVANKLGISILNYHNLTFLLTGLQVDYFKEILQKCLLNSTLPKTSAEQQSQYHLLVGGLLSSLARTYTVQSHRRPGKRSREYILISYPECGKDAIIVEYELGKSAKKLSSTVQAGLKRLVGRHYDKEIRDCRHIKQITKIYMAFSKRRVAIQYEVSEDG